MRPEFDHDEEYVIAFYRRHQKSGRAGHIAQDAVAVTVGAAFFVFGHFKDDVAWSMIGFGLVAYHAVRGLISSVRYNRILARIIDKYEGALYAEKRCPPAD